MKRILVTGGANIGRAGVATVVYSFGKNLDSNKVVYDYLMQRGISDSKYKEEIEKKGGRVFELHTRSRGISKFIKTLKWYSAILKNNNYEILHINCDTAYVVAIYLLIAKMVSNCKIIVHSHNTRVDEENRFKRFLKLCFHYGTRCVARSADIRMACSTIAAEWMFGKRYIEKKGFEYIGNGIDAESFSFSERDRNKYRNEMKLNGEYVVGCVGRLAYQKNYDMLLTIFKDFNSQVKKSKLIIVGDGELKERLHEKAKSLEIIQNVLFLGNRSDVSQLMSAMDVFALPSMFEGFGLVYIEAQASGLQCLASNNVPDDVMVTDLIEKLPLSKNIWVNALIKCHKKRVDRAGKYRCIQSVGYDIKTTVIKLEKIYLYDERLNV